MCYSQICSFLIPQPVMLLVMEGNFFNSCVSLVIIDLAMQANPSQEWINSSTVREVQEVQYTGF